MYHSLRISKRNASCTSFSREGLRLRKLLLEVGEVLLTQRTEVTIQIVVCHKKSSRDHVLSNPSIRL